MWPVDPQELMALQVELAAATTEPWRPPVDPSVAACWVNFPRGLTGRGGPGDPAWTAAVTVRAGRVVAWHEQRGAAGAAYVPGLLALRLGPMCEAAVRALRPLPDVVLVDATGRDHPRHGGLALHLGAPLDLPSVGVTHRPLPAHGDWPADKTGAVSPLVLDGVVVGYWLRTRAGMRPIAVHAGWRTDPETATAIVLGALRGHRPPLTLGMYPPAPAGLSREQHIARSSLMSPIPYIRAETLCDSHRFDLSRRSVRAAPSAIPSPAVFWARNFSAPWAVMPFIAGWAKDRGRPPHVPGCSPIWPAWWGSTPAS